MRPVICSILTPILNNIKSQCWTEIWIHTTDDLISLNMTRNRVCWNIQVERSNETYSWHWDLKNKQESSMEDNTIWVSSRYYGQIGIADLFTSAELCSTWKKLLGTQTWRNQLIQKNDSGCEMPTYNKLHRLRRLFYTYLICWRVNFGIHMVASCYVHAFPEASG
jgi:hypothetical protein